MDLKRLSKFLAAAGVASRRGSEKIIFDKRVQVNGETIDTPQYLIDPLKDKITIDGEPMQKEEKKVYFILNKPPHYHCTSARSGQKKIVLDLFDKIPCRLFTVGRLDKDTTGLLIVTNDGLLSQKIIHPSANLEKEYLVKVKEILTHDHILKLLEGAYIEGKRIKPVKVNKIRKGTFKITVKEGKKHEVKILTKNAGLNLVELSRIRIGPLNLGPIPIGFYRKMTEKEVGLFL